MLLPSYHHVLRLNYIILKQRLLGNIPDFIKLHHLHANMDFQELEAFFQQQNQQLKNSPTMRLILATDFAESISDFKRIRYIIDTGRMLRCIQNNGTHCKEYIFEWVCRQTMRTRLYLFDPGMGMYICIYIF